MRIQELHRQAMDFAEKALMAKHQGELERSYALFRQAFEKEKKSADFFQNHLNEEPTRSVFYRSAASLALQCEEFREAERLIATALSGNPPNEIAEELRDLLEKLYFQWNKQLRQVG
jgi:tetratricopeptide (TPR) repeat protein